MSNLTASPLRSFIVTLSSHPPQRGILARTHHQARIKACELAGAPLNDAEAMADGAVFDGGW